MEYLFTTKTNKLYERPFRNYTIRQSVTCFSGKKSCYKIQNHASFDAGRQYGKCL